MLKKSTFLAIAVALAGPAAAFDGLAGSYLAARQASIAGDFQIASNYLERVVESDPGNIDALESLILSQIAIGRFDQAIPLSDRIVEAGVQSQVAHIVQIAKAVQQENYKALVDQLDLQKGIGHSVVDGLLIAWASVGAGDVQAALAQMKALQDQETSVALIHYHMALIYSVVGDFETAETLFEKIEDEPGALTRRAIIVRLQSLMMSGAFDKGSGRVGQVFWPEFRSRVASNKRRNSRK